MPYGWYYFVRQLGGSWADSRHACLCVHLHLAAVLRPPELEVDVEDDAVAQWLHYATVAPPGPSRAATRQRLAEVAIAGELRDVTFTAEFYAALFTLVQASWDDEDWEDRKTAYVVLENATKAPEFDGGLAGSVLPSGWVAGLFQRLVSSSKVNASEELPFVKSVLHWLYKTVIPARSQVRREIGGFVARFLRTQLGHHGISVLLEVLACIIRGFRSPMSKVHDGVFHQLLLPLHMPHGKLTETQPVLSVYHEPLVYCMSLYMRADPAVYIPASIRGIVESWPDLADANSPKEVLLMHELENCIDLTEDAEIIRPAVSEIRGVLIRGITSDYAMLQQKALTLFKNKKFVDIYMATMHDSTTHVLFPMLLQNGKKHWNATVNKLRVSVLRVLRERDSATFTRLCNESAKLSAELPADTTKSDDVEGGAGSSESKGAGSEDDPEDDPSLSPAERHVLRLFRIIHPPEPDVSGDPSRDVMSETPTLQPTMRFHDLAFGRTLGTGSFSTVKFAKHIVRGTPTSQWSEYAVKIISRKLIKRLGYEASVCREIAVLRTLSHPGLARLVASFRWRDGAYLVLEYGSRGDLHEQLTEMGSLSEESTRFAIGEIVAALHSIHEKGFVYGDLKPENVVITADGHMKLTDLGAVRPVSDAAREYVKAQRNVMAELRDGDWERAATTQTQSTGDRPRSSNREVTGSTGRKNPPLTITGAWPGAAGPAGPHPRRARPPTGAPWAAPGGGVAASGGAKRRTARPPTSATWASSSSSVSRAARPAAGAAAVPPAQPKVKYARNLPARPIARGVWPDPLPSMLAQTTDGSGIDASGAAAREKKEVLREDGTLVESDDDAEDEAKTDGGAALPTLGWGSAAGAGGDAGDGGSDSDVATAGAVDDDDGTRLEGTAAYLAPELVRGAAPSPVSDAWALGCVLYQLLAGRPPIWAESEPEIMSRIVSFESAERTFPPDFPAEAKDLVTKLMETDPAKRLGAGERGILEVADHPFLASLGGVSTLFKQTPPEMEHGSARPQVDAAWSRRQNSILWTPSPHKYDVMARPKTFDTVEETAVEASVPFLPKLQAIPESMGPPPARPPLVGKDSSGPVRVPRG